MLDKNDKKKIVRKTMKKYRKTGKLFAMMLFTVLFCLTGCSLGSEKEYCGSFFGEKHIDAMGCDISISITLEEDGSYRYRREPMTVAMEGGGEMEALEDKGTYVIKDSDITFQGKTLGAFTVSLNKESDVISLRGNIPTGGASTEMTLYKDKKTKSGNESVDNKKINTDADTAAKDYYLDLSELGMNLTVYLRLYEDGRFIFSNSLSFETDKSSGVYEKSGESYLMSFTSVNGEEKTATDGLTSGFTKKEDGTLDFSTSCERVYYGSATIVTTGEDNPDAKLIAVPVSADFDEPDTDTVFEAGTYAAKEKGKDGVTYYHMVSFYEDNTYLHTTTYTEKNKEQWTYESGEYGVSTSVLALVPQDGERAECEVVSEKKLHLSVFAKPGDKKRTLLEFSKEKKKEKVVSLKGKGAITGTGEHFDVVMQIYLDGSYEAKTDGFTEKGILLLDTKKGYAKQYPDHPDSGERGLNQVTTVPYGSCQMNPKGKLTLKDMRIRNSDGLTRYKTTLIENK